MNSAIEPAGAAATAAVGLAFIDSSRAMAEAFVATEHEEPDEWQDVAFLGNADPWPEGGILCRRARGASSPRAGIFPPQVSRL